MGALTIQVNLMCIYDDVTVDAQEESVSPPNLLESVSLHLEFRRVMSQRALVDHHQTNKELHLKVRCVMSQRASVNLHRTNKELHVKF